MIRIVVAPSFARMFRPKVAGCISFRLGDERQPPPIDKRAHYFFEPTRAANYGQRF
jgi:hypothetical protein